MWEKYITATTLEDAMHLLNANAGQSRIVAGATDLILEIENGIRPDLTTLIDVTKIPGIDRIALDLNGWVHLGPMVTHNHCAGSRLIRDHACAKIHLGRLVDHFVDVGGYLDVSKEGVFLDGRQDGA